MRILFLGEIVGRCGIGVIKNALKSFRNDRGIDLVIANGEGATSGFGLGFQNAITLQHMGIDVLTMGEKSFFKIDMV
ncbi:MAG: YmdB family metallophosphoesterase, partial [Spirochaetales bacterium]|nr:YmdB family metallophosphoesterase [Spirochaetales bacterium]